MARVDQEWLQVVMLAVAQLSCATSGARLWKTMYMDHKDDCSSVIRNDDMAEGDKYSVKSSMDAAVKYYQQPAECSVGFNFGDRFASVRILDWSCEKRNVTREPFVEIHDDCDGQRKKLLAVLNCTSPLPPMPIISPSSCLSVYHYRDHTTKSYYFDMEVLAILEVLAFPVGGVAAIIITSIVVLMVIVKIICVISGYENRLPDIHFLDPEEQKQILEGSINEQLIQIHNNQDEEPLQGMTSSSGPEQEKSRTRSLVVASDPGHHRILTMSRSVGSGSHCSAGADVPSDVDYDFLDVVDLPSTPRLKRYPSAKASSIWRHK